ncbi:MAG: hypothetical protein WEB33_08380 [Bacteroidota bacterium]
MSTIQNSVYKELAPITKEDPLTFMMQRRDQVTLRTGAIHKVAATLKLRGIYG